ncbi:MAG: hypothetical protein ABS939_00200 [Psychrobacillus sp.]
MDKFWGSIEKSPDPGKEVDIFRTIFFTKAECIGQIREEFNSWELNDLERLLEDIEYSSITDEGRWEETTFGTRWEYSYHPILESKFTDWCSNHIWATLRPKKKRFF